MAACLLRVSGLVQGVGFRPTVWHLAHRLALRGWVRNDGAGVSILLAGDAVALDDFVARLPRELPRLARIDSLTREAAPATMTIPADFRILDSGGGQIVTAIGPDAALCPACAAEICDPDHRRWRYAFTTCTHCGPRYTVSQRIPYDRATTSLAPFPLCAPCAAEYGDVADRRFHAETTCCPDCGPALQLLDAAGHTLAGDPVSETLRRLQAGEIVAIKGLGGFHLACDARHAAAVARLRARKQREAKPFAVMGLNAASLREIAEISSAAEALLTSTAAPIVLCPKTALELEGIAPALAEIGVMIPATPLHLLLWHEAAGQAHGTDWLAARHPLLLVMTSANPHGEPLLIDNTEALHRLHGIADAYLLHNRDIVVRCDDSVVRPGHPAQYASNNSNKQTLLRRARGYVPLPVKLAATGNAASAPVILALGGYLKNTVCVLKGDLAYLSQYIGSLDNVATLDFLEASVRHLLAMLDVTPALIVHDLHPDYPSSQLAARLAAEFDVPVQAIAHHHAHLAAVCAEQGLNQQRPVIGLALDGVGLGPDGTAWGGELLRLNGASCERLGHLQPLLLPGGDKAAREPWRLAVAALHQAGLQAEIAHWFEQTLPQRDPASLPPLLLMLERQLRCPPTSSLGRWFDAVAGLLGVCEVMAYEGQAAMQLEALASSYLYQHDLYTHPLLPEAAQAGFTLHPRANGLILDFYPLLPTLLALRKAGETAQAAALFHATIAQGLAAWLQAAQAQPQGQCTLPHDFAISGGCAMNALLMQLLHQALDTCHIVLHEAQHVPPNDAGLALGQAQVAYWQQQQQQQGQ